MFIKLIFEIMIKLNECVYLKNGCLVVKLFVMIIL